MLILLIPPSCWWAVMLIPYRLQDCGGDARGDAVVSQSAIGLLVPGWKRKRKNYSGGGAPGSCICYSQSPVAIGICCTWAIIHFNFV